MLSSSLFIIFTYCLSCLYIVHANNFNPPIRRSAHLLPPGVEPSAGCNECKSSLSFAGKEAKQYEVGNNVPTLPFKTKTSWSGQIDIPDTPSVQNGSLYFWLWGQDAKVAGDDLVIWMNGGPGCTSNVGLLTENGPFLFPSDDGEPYPNNYSWTLSANMLYITQPVGDAFTSGHSRNINEFQTSDQFALWLQRFFEIFPELGRKRLWMVGESYQGVFLPYLYKAISRNPPLGNASMLQGGMLVDPTITKESVQFSVPTYNFVKEHQKLLNFTDKDVAIVRNESDRCQLTNFAEENLHYPPRGRLPTPNPNCTPFTTYYKLARQRVKYFNIYNIAKPHKRPRSVPEPFEVFLNDTDVQKYIHAPTVGYATCNPAVFGKWRDRTAAPPDQLPSYEDSYLAQMIEHSKRFVIVNGLLDGIVINTGNRIALQNLTWNGGQGFNKPVHVPLYDVDGGQTAIATDEERGLTYVEVPDSGHMMPGDQPAMGLASLQFLLGQRDWTKKQ